MTPEDLPHVLAALDVPMIVVTAADGSRRAGCLVGFHSQCSIEPTRYAVWISRANETFDVAMGSDHLALHLLASSDRGLAVLFGTTTGAEVDKFARCDHETGPGGVPVLAGCGNVVVGRRCSTIDGGGDHVCFVVEPVEVRSSLPFTPLRYRDVDDLTAGHPAGGRDRD